MEQGRKGTDIKSKQHLKKKYIYRFNPHTLAYEKVEATLTIAVEGAEGVEQIILPAKSIKRIENGNVLIENNGVRYNMNGAAF